MKGGEGPSMSRGDASALLHQLGAPARLLRHVELVGEAAEALLAALAEHTVPLDATFVRAGVVLHDVGKILHPAELAASGARHEAAGEQLLRQRGVAPALARVCVTHAAWQAPDVTLEERVVALADKLWKGARVGELETLVVDGAAARRGVDRWQLLIALDNAFERIAAGGDERLARAW
ncbi:MAG: HD domain-containing protein [Planctomycetes bacterium]|nr:HD domain-containing protein [Planctomycetota bacterium]